MSDETVRLPAGAGGPRTVRVARRLNAPPERVSRAWSEPDELARWLPDRVEGGLAVGARTVLAWEDHRTWWEVLEERTGEAFVFRRPWLANDRLVTTVRVSFTPAGYGTLLELEEEPFPLDQPGVIDAWAESIGDWREALAMLRAVLDFSVDIRTRP